MMKQTRVITSSTCFLMPIYSILAQMPTTDRPNILWLVSEDNTVFLGCYGDKFAQTPVLDKMAKEGVLYENAFCAAPVSAPSRSALITGMYPPSIGTHQMRSKNTHPPFLEIYTKRLMSEGYYCVNGPKCDYNSTVSRESIWNEFSDIGMKKEVDRNTRQPGQPFYQIINLGLTHETCGFKTKENLTTNPSLMEVPPYLPDVPEIRRARAQYYDRMADLDNAVDKELKRLENDGVAENTIVVYFADNGGILGRSKRFCYENGLHVPLIIRFPKKWQHLAPAAPGTRTDRLVSFIDFPVSMLNMLGLPIANYYQGQPFLGNNNMKEREYAYMFRDRMDERYDMVRVVRNKRYKYNRNYMPHRPYGQHVSYMWQAEGQRAWERAFNDGKCNSIQSVFWKTKPAEELYDIQTDPHEINNLVASAKHKMILDRMRREHHRWTAEIFDTGFIPEAELLERCSMKRITPWELVRSKEFPYTRVVETAEMATMFDEKHMPELIKRLSDSEASVRYWAATGCIVLPKKDASTIAKLKDLATNDPSMNVRLAAAEALHAVGNTTEAVELIANVLRLNSKQEAITLHALNIVDLIGEPADVIRHYMIEKFKGGKAPTNTENILQYWKELGIK